jgi:hypothetical protein
MVVERRRNSTTLGEQWKLIKLFFIVKTNLFHQVGCGEKRTQRPM